MATEAFDTLKLGDLTPGEEVGFDNPREKMDAGEIKSLAADIQQRGLLYPLQVWPTEKDGKKVYVLIGGHRRKAAIEKLLEEDEGNGFKKGVPVRYVEGATLLEAKYNALADNIQRVDLTSYELAQDISRFKTLGENQKDIATKLHKSETWVSRNLTAFSKASKALKTAWKSGHLSDDNVQDIAKLPEDEQEVSVLALVKERSGGRKGKGKARKAAKKRANKLQRASTKELQEFIVFAEEAPKDLRYVRGMRDAFAFAIGSIEIDGFDGEWKRFFKEQQKAAEAKAAADAEKAREWAESGKGKGGKGKKNGAEAAT